MMIHIHIKDNVTGEEVINHHDSDWNGDFIWVDGNYACDCNRALFFGEAKNGVWPDEDETPCGHERYSIPFIELDDGTKKIIDDSSPVP